MFSTAEVLANQLGRRNLADIDRIALARKRESVLKPLAEDREKRGKGDDGSGGRGNKKNPSAELRQGFKTSKESAKTAGVGAGLIGHRTKRALRLSSLGSSASQLWSVSASTDSNEHCDARFVNF